MFETGGNQTLRHLEYQLPESVRSAALRHRRGGFADEAAQARDSAVDAETRDGIGPCERRILADRLAGFLGRSECVEKVVGDRICLAETLTHFAPGSGVTAGRDRTGHRGGHEKGARLRAMVGLEGHRRFALPRLAGDEAVGRSHRFREHGDERHEPIRCADAISGKRVERHHDERVTDEDRDRLTEGAMNGKLPPTEVRIVEAWQVIVNERGAVNELQGTSDALRDGGALAFEDVSFRHDARANGLEDVSFTVQPGTTTALVGPSGSGKSTIVKLALRLLDPQVGRVVIDGADVRDVTQASLRRAVALVPQDVALFNDTLAVNIAFARPEADEAAIWAAAEAAELAEFIRSLPDGMETRVGERGLKLSGGERQRVGIARALLADPCILILDEATSALDSRTEAAIQKTLRKAKAGRTTLVVAHRLSTIADAEQILVLKAGRIVERGAHHELVARVGGEYAALWKKQTRGARIGLDGDRQPAG